MYIGLCSIRTSRFGAAAVVEFESIRNAMLYIEMPCPTNEAPNDAQPSSKIIFPIAARTDKRAEQAGGIALHARKRVSEMNQWYNIPVKSKP